MKIPTGQEYAAKIINTKKLSARGGYFQPHIQYMLILYCHVDVGSVVCRYIVITEL